MEHIEDSQDEADTGGYSQLAEAMAMDGQAEGDEDDSSDQEVSGSETGAEEMTESEEDEEADSDVPHSMAFVPLKFSRTTPPAYLHSLQSLSLQRIAPFSRNFGSMLQHEMILNDDWRT